MNTKNTIKTAKGKFTVKFIKKDGTKRTMTVRRGVAINLKGGVNKVEAPDRPYVTVYDTEKKGYRTINTDTVYEIKIKGVKHYV